ncbi:unnamed protein product [Aspergillus oryzae]|nr:unnamed protein product [Aspergillus oryzae]
MWGETLKFLILEATTMSGEPSATGLPPPSPATTAPASFVDRNEFFSEGQIFYADASFNGLCPSHSKDTRLTRDKDSVVVNVQTTGGGYGLKPNREELRQTCQLQTLTGQSGKFFLKYIRDQLQNPEFCNTEDGKLATLAVKLQAQVWVRLNNSGPARPATLEYLWLEMKEDGTAPVTWIMLGVFDGYSGLFRGPEIFSRRIALHTNTPAPPASHRCTAPTAPAAALPPPPFELGRDCEVVVKQGDPNTVRSFRRLKSTEMKKQAQKACKRGARANSAATLTSIQFIAARQLKPGDLSLSLRSAKEAEIAHSHRATWISGSKAVLDKDIPVATMDGVDVAQAEQLRGPPRLARGDMDQQKQPLQEAVHLLEVAMDRGAAPGHLGLAGLHVDKLLPEPVAGQDPVHQPPRPAGRQRRAVGGLLEEAPVPPDQALPHLPVALVRGGLEVDLDRAVPDPGPLQEGVDPDLVELVHPTVLDGPVRAVDQPREALAELDQQRLLALVGQGCQGRHSGKRMAV